VKGISTVEYEYLSRLFLPDLLEDRRNTCIATRWLIAGMVACPKKFLVWLQIPMRVIYLNDYKF
jgi:hypothetical protein